ncbi:hypothetical protein HanXRQr2_Chr04g0185881 [Helianthus annuus]|uniref:Uncharacterized protein n=1 Tax=Helianthus annuus TaxID=4232 RepID=A0A9K3JCE5_HELAN|nr:hypothetical protein HanXRQr2_Chr04g0185881 [Helianthus annuus]
MELHSAKKRIQLFKKRICGTSGLHYFRKKLKNSWGEWGLQGTTWVGSDFFDEACVPSI